MMECIDILCTLLITILGLLLIVRAITVEQVGKVLLPVFVALGLICVLKGALVAALEAARSALEGLACWLVLVILAIAVLMAAIRRTGRSPSRQDHSKE